METAQEKADYLLGQAKAFYSSDKFQEAVDTAKYILRYLDKDSQEAKALFEKALDGLKAKAKETVEGATKKLGNFGN